MSDTVNLALIINDETSDTQRQIQAGEVPVDAAGNAVIFGRRDSRAPLPGDNQLPIGSYWFDDVTRKLYQLIDMQGDAAVWGNLADQINDIQGQLQPKPALYAYNGSRLLLTNNTAQTVPYSVGVIFDASLYAWAPTTGVVTLSAATRIYVQAQVTVVSRNTNGAVAGSIWVEYDNVEVAGSRAYVSCPNKDLGNTISTSCIVEVVSGGQISVRVQRTSGNPQLDIIAQASRLHLQSEGAIT